MYRYVIGKKKKKEMFSNKLSIFYIFIIHKYCIFCQFSQLFITVFHILFCTKGFYSLLVKIAICF